MASTRVPLIKTDTAAQDMAEKLEMSTAEIGLTVRTDQLPGRAGDFHVADLLSCTREDLLAISNFGEKTLEEVYRPWKESASTASRGRHRPARGPRNRGKLVLLAQ